MSGMDIDLTTTLVGFSVRAGYPKPDISTVTRFKDALLRAGSINLSPSTGSIYMRTCSGNVVSSN